MTESLTSRVARSVSGSVNLLIDSVEDATLVKQLRFTGGIKR